MPETRPINALNMVVAAAANDVLNQAAPKVPLTKRTSVQHMAAANDVLNQDVPNVPLAKLINALNMAVVSDVLN